MGVNFGIIGLGDIARKFAKNINLSKDANLACVAARSFEKAEAFKKEFGAKKAVQTYEDVAKDETVDIIYIALTHNFHYEMIKMCLQNNKAVVCEKPMVLHQSEAIELFALAKTKNLLLIEAMWTRFQPGYKKIKQWINEDKIGTVNMIDAEFGFNAPFEPLGRLYNKELAGGALYDAGVYPVEFALGIAQSPVSKISSDCYIGKSGVDEYNSVQIVFENDIIACCKSAVSTKLTSKGLVYGEKGYIETSFVVNTKRVSLFDNEGNLLESFEDPIEDGFIHQVDHVVWLVQNKKIDCELIPQKDTIACAKIFDKVLT